MLLEWVPCAKLSPGWEAEPGHILFTIFIFLFVFFWLHHEACRILVPCQGSNPCHLQWKC